MFHKKSLYPSLLSLALLAAWPLQADDKSSTREGLVKLPTAGGTVQTDESSFHVSPSHGGVSYSVPLPGLPSRGGTNPKLAIQYSQTSGDNGSGFGIGWSVGVPAIYVNDDFGTAIRQRYPENQDFFSHLSLDGQRLISVALEDAYAEPQFALESSSSSAHIVYTRQSREIKVLGLKGETRTVSFPGGFIVSYPDGRKSYFAEQESSTEWDLNAPTHATRWPLTLTVNPQGEAVEYFYFKLPAADKQGKMRPAGRSYLKTVKFAGGASRYEFELIETRGSLISYRTAYRLSNEMLYGGVRAYYADELQGSMCFGYVGRSKDSDALVVRSGAACQQQAGRDLASDLTGDRSLNILDQLRMVYSSGASETYGSDAHFPSTRFSYSHWQESFVNRSVVFDVPALADINPRTQRFELFDANLDALVDIVSSSNGSTQVKLGQDSLDASFDQASTWQIQRDGITINPNIDSAAFHFADMNGDSLVDLVEIASGKIYVYFRKSDGAFEYSGSPILLPWINGNLFANQTFRWLDLNGDGLTDILSSQVANGQGNWRVFVNRTTRQESRYHISFKETSLRLPAALSSAFMTDSNTIFADVNGDQLIDFVRVLPSKQGFCLYENQGDLYGKADKFLFAHEYPSTLDRTQCDDGKFIQVDGLASSLAAGGNRVWFMDVNGDGIMDLSTFTDNDSNLKVWLGFGNGDFLQNPLNFSLLDSADRVQIALGNSGRELTRLADIDGDGQNELVIFQPGTASIKPIKVIDFNRLEHTQLIKSNLLTTVESETGLRYDVRYVSSIDEMLRDRDRGLPQGYLHYPTYVVKQLVTSERDAATGDYKAGREVREMQYHQPYFDPFSRKFLGFHSVETIVYGDEFLGSEQTQTSYYKREVFADDYRLSGNVVASYIHEYRPTDTFADQSEDADRISLSDSTLHSMKNYAQGQAIAEPGRLLRSSQYQWELVQNQEGYNDEKAYYQRLLGSSGSTYGSDNSVAVTAVVHRDFDAYNIPWVTKEQRNAIQGPSGLVIPARTVERRSDFTVSRQQLSERGIIGLPSRVEIFAGEGPLEKIADSQFTYSDSGQLLKKTDAVFRDPALDIQALKPAPARVAESSYDVFGNTLTNSENKVLLESIVYDPTGTFAIEQDNAIGHRTKMFYGHDPIVGCRSTPDIQVFEGRLKGWRDLRGVCHFVEYDAFGRRSHYLRDDGYEELYSYAFASKGKPSRLLKKARRYLDSASVPANELNWIETLDVYHPNGTKIASLENVEDGLKTSDGSWQGVRVVAYELQNRQKKTIKVFTPYKAAELTLKQVFDSGVVPTAGQGAATRTSYDGLGRPVRRQYPTERVEMLQYEPWGHRLTSVYDKGLGRGQNTVSKVFVKVDDQVFGLIDEKGAITRFAYDIYGNLESIWLSGQTQPRRYVSDSFGRKLQQCVPGIGCSVFNYDEMGHLFEKIVFDRNGVKKDTLLTYYDVLSRLTDTYENGRLIARHQYDSYPVDRQIPTAESALGLLTVMETFDGNRIHDQTKVFYYDRLGREILRKTTLTGTRYDTLVESFQYALDGVLEKSQDPFGVKSRYHLANTMRFSRLDVELPWAPNVREVLIDSVSYNAKGQIERLGYREGSSTNLAYNEQTLQLEQIQSRYKRADGQEEFLQNARLDFDGNGSVVKIDDTVAAATSFGPIHRSGRFDYNDRNELVRSERYGEVHEFAYDGAGNFTQNTELGKTLVPSTINALFPPGSSDHAYAFDSQGRLSGRQFKGKVESPDPMDDLQRRRTIVATQYNSVGLLTYLKTDKSEIFYGYDGNGTRYYKQVRDLTTGDVKDSLYPSKTVVIEPSGAQSFVFIGNKRVARIDHGANLATPGRWYYYLLDHLSSTDFLMHANGVPVEQMIYRAYGSEPSLLTFSQGKKWMQHVAARQSILPKERTHHRYTGQYLDDDSGLYYYGARYYDPLLGRFISPDPLFMAQPENCTKSPLECALYSYAANNPMNYIDPTGLLVLHVGSCASGTAAAGPGVTVQGCVGSWINVTWDGIDGGSYESAGVSGTWGSAGADVGVEMGVLFTADAAALDGDSATITARGGAGLGGQVGLNAGSDSQGNTVWGINGNVGVYSPQGSASSGASHGWHQERFSVGWDDVLEVGSFVLGGSMGISNYVAKEVVDYLSPPVAVPVTTITVPAPRNPAPKAIVAKPAAPTAPSYEAPNTCDMECTQSVQTVIYDDASETCSIGSGCE